VDEDGGDAKKSKYDAFGNLASSSGSITNSFQYTARDFDSETGLRYYRARYYDATGARLISEDTFKEVLRGLNFYAYVRNDPVENRDPNGKDSCGWLC
jgi:RHS repeat-associated protein